MGPLLWRIFFGCRRLDGVDTLSEPGIYHLPVEIESKLYETLGLAITEDMESVQLLQM